MECAAHEKIYGCSSIRAHNPLQRPVIAEEEYLLW